ncbi:MAG TPA: hypothetical protein VFH54_19315 [Mycobacteriales bacterium]|nr:hypothetical protein [Mycobacteriales bacterium]
MTAAALVAVGGGGLLPLGRWWASLVGGFLILCGFVVLALGLYVGPRGQG